MNRNERAEYARRLIARFRQLRDDEGWTQETLAEESGVALRTVSDVLRGRSIPNEGTAEKLGRALGLQRGPAQVEETWPEDIKTFLRIMGIYLNGLSDLDRENAMREITERIFARSA